MGDLRENDWKDVMNDMSVLLFHALFYLSKVRIMGQSK